jgi:putative hydrolase
MPRVSSDSHDDDNQPNPELPSDLPPDPFGPGDPPGVTASDPTTPNAPNATGAVDGGPSGGGDPFSMFSAMFGPGMDGVMSQLGALLGGQGRFPWDMTRQIALMAASGGATGSGGASTESGGIGAFSAEPNVSPLERIRFEELLRIAEPHVVELTALPLTSGGALKVEAVTRAGWAADFLEQHRSLFERLATSLSRPGAGSTDLAAMGSSDPFGGILAMLGPSLLAMQVGGMTGQLANRALGGFDLLLPRKESSDGQVMVVPTSIDAFATTWSLTIDDVRLRVLLGEMCQLAVLRIPHVRTRLSDALGRHADGYRIDPDALTKLAEGMDPTDPDAMQSAFGDPQRLLGAMSTPKQEEARNELLRLVTVITGWVDHTVAMCSNRLLGHDRIGEALRRRRLESGPGERMLEQLLGIRCDRSAVERGAAFVRGVVERDPDQLQQLWTSTEHFPTANELDAPGLWIARLDVH